MTNDEIKDYIKDYFIEHGYRTFEDGSTLREQLDVVAIRYQYFGGYMFKIYKHDLSNCALRSHRWFLLEMVNPKTAMITTNMYTALGGVLDNIDIKLWKSAYEYYDDIGHDKFGPLAPWLDEHRDILYPLNYDIV